MAERACEQGSRVVGGAASLFATRPQQVLALEEEGPAQQ